MSFDVEDIIVDGLSLQRHDGGLINLNLHLHISFIISLYVMMMLNILHLAVRNLKY